VALNSDQIGLAASGAILLLLLAAIVAPMVLRFVRAARWPLWLVLGFSVVAQMAGLTVWWVIPRVDGDDGRVLCLTSPILDLGRDAFSLEMAVPACRAASVERVVIGAFILVIAYAVWALALAYAFQHRTAALTKLKRWQLIVGAATVAILVVGALLRLGIIPVTS